MSLNVVSNAPQNVTRYRSQSRDNLQKYAFASWNANRFNDVCVKSGDVSFAAHRLVLGCYSPFFERLFDSPMKEQYEGTVTLNELDGEAVRLLIDYMYIGSVTVNHENAFSLLAAANYLQMNEVCQFCFDFLDKAISLESWSAIHSTLQLYENNSLLSRLYQFISENLIVIAQSDDFKNLKVKDLISVIQNLNRALVKEQVIYDTIINWIYHDEGNRRSKFASLLMLIDLQSLPFDFLEDVVATEPLVKANNESLNAVLNAISKQFKVMRLIEKGSKLISVSGLYTPRYVVEVFQYFGKSRCKPTYPDLPVAVLNSKALWLNNYIYNIGGFSEWIGTMNQVFQMNIKNDKQDWKQICPMREKRHLFGASVFKDCLVVAGGAESKSKNKSTSEFYFPAMNKWEQISPLNCPRAANELVTCSNSLYALGGSNEQQALSSMERLSNLDGKWKEVKSMNYPRTVFAAVSCQGSIYAIGGLCENTSGNLIVLKSVEKYCPREDKWIFVSNMNTERMEHAACVLQDKIFVVGGWNADNKLVRSLDCYDPLSDQWTEVDKTVLGLTGHSLIVI